ncbi:SCO-spondin-like [Mixophyes fleayi]|uniref:SCO-spondin-like n=1 Tax=Mixophyes fleayi TaxID=3061075 RepID=UPI003F4DAA7A
MALTSLHLLMTISVTFLLSNAQTTTTTTITTTTITTNNSQTTATHCGENKEFNECGSACPTNCSQYNAHPICTEQCVHGCFCRKDYLPDESGRCVPRNLCESCKGNTTFTGCGTGCPKTCDNMRDTGVKGCIKICKVGCACQPGYVLLNEKQESCVLPQDCPKKIPEQ